MTTFFQQHRHFHTISAQNCPNDTEPDFDVVIRRFHTKYFNFGQKVITEIAYEFQKEIGDLKVTLSVISRNNF